MPVPTIDQFIAPLLSSGSRPGSWQISQAGPRPSYADRTPNLPL
jgi:hypothetical protein